MPGAAWRTRGVVRPFVVEVVATAWRGTQIDRTVTAYLADLRGSHALDGAIAGFVDGGSLDAIRREAARRYAEGQGRPFARVLEAFTNPGDPRWRAILGP